MNNFVITAAARYREDQIRPFLASLRHFSPDVSLKLIVDQHRSEFETAVRAWFPDCTFHLLPPAPLRDFALKRKWAASILKRASRWSGSRKLGLRLLRIHYLRYIVVRDLLNTMHVRTGRILLCDSRDLVFQDDPFRGEWPELWTVEEDKRLEECAQNTTWFVRAGSRAAFESVKHQRIVNSGVTGGSVEAIRRYLDAASRVVEELAPRIPLTVGDQGIHNNLVRLRPELNFTVLPNGHRLCANIGCTLPSNLVVENGRVRLREREDFPQILHQYDRHPELKSMFESRWGTASPREGELAHGTSKISSRNCPAF